MYVYLECQISAAKLYLIIEINFLWFLKHSLLLYWLSDQDGA